MEKYCVIITDTFTGNTIAKMIVNEEQKKAIEYMSDQECFNRNLDIQILEYDNDWKELC